MVTILQNRYVLTVHNVGESATFYADVIGYEIVAQPLDWIFVAIDNCTIMLDECPDDMHPGDLGGHNYFAHLVVNDVDGYYEQLMQKEVPLLGEIADKPWGMREFGIKTPDEHRIMIGQRTTGAK